MVQSSGGGFNPHQPRKTTPRCDDSEADSFTSGDFGTPRFSELFLPDRRPHYRRHCLRTQEETTRVARQFRESNRRWKPVARSSTQSGMTGTNAGVWPASQQSRSECQPQITELLSLNPQAHPEPCEICNRQRSSQWLSHEIGGQVTKIDDQAPAAGCFAKVVRARTPEVGRRWSFRAPNHGDSRHGSLSATLQND
jgi:hypothetical protein